MTIFDIEVITVNDKLVPIGSGYLIHYDQDEIQSWNVELYDSENDELFDEIMDNEGKANVLIETENDKRFVGTVLVTKLKITLLGTTVYLAGTGPLKKV